MQYLIYILTFIPFIICAPLTVQQGVLSYNCPTPYGKPINIPLADTKASLRSACALSKNKSDRITNFPKSFKPGFSQKLSATSATGKYYIYPVNPTKYPNAFIIASDGCDLAGVMMSGSRGLPGSQTTTTPGVANRPGKSVRTRPSSPGSPGSPVPQSVRTIRPVVARSESDIQNIEKREIRGSDLKQCFPKTYDWNSDVSSTGRKLGVVPVPGSRTPIQKI